MVRSAAAACPCAYLPTRDLFMHLPDVTPVKRIT